ERDWQMKRDGRRGWRRVVPSPDPQAIVECDLIRTLVDSGALVIVTGGGGIPVARGPQKLLHGVEAVIDKDLASEVLARDIDAEYLIILTAVEKVILNFETDNELPLDRITVSEARRHFADGQFPPGSMGPKMEAACRFAERTGGKALITDVFTLDRALDGETGTWVVPDDSD
ncbi:MAG: carbamate kinase, partial [Acidobacteriota bacterium]